MSDELKPCPFCGATSAKLFDAWDGADAVLWSIQCEECGADGPCGDADRAIPMWNERAPNEQLTELRAERDRLVAALRYIDDVAGAIHRRADIYWVDVAERARAALEKASGDD